MGLHGFFFLGWALHSCFKITQTVPRKKENAQAAHVTGNTGTHSSVVQTLSSRLEPGKAGRRRENVIPPGSSLAAARHAAQALFAEQVVLFACDPASPGERSQCASVVCSIFCLLFFPHR